MSTGKIRIGHKFALPSAIAAGVLFLFIALQVKNRPILLDAQILQFLHAHSSPFFDSLFLIITTVGNVEILGPIVLLTVFYLWRRQLKDTALFLALCVVGASAGNVVLKHLFHRHRPTLWHSILHETDFSFPSGHAMLSFTFGLSIVIILWQTRWRWYAVAGASAFAIAIGLSRLYLGVHYPSDIVAGWCAGIVWVSLVSYYFSKKYI
ncbi:MAG: phosphatase PAP2 family protein [Patescibacteria group bacterium]|nr:phosphatase PAP2 family protein [Patescibacteria group bacterium]